MPFENNKDDSPKFVYVTDPPLIPTVLKIVAVVACVVFVVFDAVAPVTAAIVAAVADGIVTAQVVVSFCSDCSLFLREFNASTKPRA